MKYNAVDLAVKIAVTQLGGKGGGGRKDLAQGGGQKFFICKCSTRRSDIAQASLSDKK